MNRVHDENSSGNMNNEESPAQDNQNVLHSQRRSSKKMSSLDNQEQQNKEQQNPEQQNKEGEEGDKKQKKCDWKKAAPKIAIVLIIAGFFTYAIIDSSRVSDGFESFIEWVEDNPGLGILVLMLAYVAATVLFFPGSILTLGAGFVFARALDNVALAVLIGSVAVWTGAMVGSVIAMILGRYVFREVIQEKALKVKTFKAIDQAVKNDGFKITLMLRVSPLIPFNLFNYMMGLTAVSVREYTLGGFGMIPATVFFVYIGTTLDSVSKVVSGDSDGGVLQLIFLVIGLIVGIVALVFIGIKTKKELKKYIDMEEGEKKENEQKDNDQQQNGEVINTQQNQDIEAQDSNKPMAQDQGVANILNDIQQ